MAVMTLSTRDTLFLSKVAMQRHDGCWIWTAARNAQGYGVFWDGTRTVLAHRYWWERMNHWLPPILDHFVCDTPLCVNPAHLRPATTRRTSGEPSARTPALTATCTTRPTQSPDRTVSVTRNGSVESATDNEPSATALAKGRLTWP